MAGWRKSTYSASASSCVEVAAGIGIRDSKAPVAHVEVGQAAWTSFLGTVKQAR